MNMRVIRLFAARVKRRVPMLNRRFAIYNKLNINEFSAMKLRKFFGVNGLLSLIVLGSSPGAAYSQAFDYDNDTQRVSATLIAVSTHEAIFQRWKKSCGPVIGLNDPRFEEANRGWEVRNRKILMFTSELREDFRKSDPISKAMVDEDFPQIAEAMANSVALANELLGKRHPPALAAWCKELMNGVADGRLDIRNRLDPQLKAFVARFIGN